VRGLAQVAPIGGAVSPSEVRGGANPSEPCLACALAGAHKTAYPIDVSTGAFYHSFADLSSAGRVPLELSRTYSSDAASVGTDGPFGFGWSFSYGMSLSVDQPSGKATVHQENGSVVSFTSTSGTWAPTAPRVQATLANTAGTWTFTRRGTQVFSFDASGRLTGAQDNNARFASPAYAVALAYDAAGHLATISAPGGRVYTLTWTAAHITSVHDGATPARTVSYAYDAAGNLTDVYGLNTTRTPAVRDDDHAVFGYDGSHRMTTMASPRFFADTSTTPTPVVTNHYDTSGRVDWQSDPDGRVTSFDYTGVAGSTITTSPKGDKTLDALAYGVVVAETRGYTSPQASTWSFAYSPVSLGLVAVIDPNGHVRSATYDARGNRVSATDPLGDTTTATYNELNEPLRSTDAKGTTTTNTYDTPGNLTSSSTPLADPAGAPVTDASGRPVVRTTTYNHADAAHPGDVTSLVGPANQTWSFHYDPAGNRDSMTAPPTPENPAGNKTTWANDPQTGFVSAMTSPLGNLAGGVAAQHTTSYAVDPYGQVTQVKDPLWSASAPTAHQVTRHYNADHQADSVSDGDNHTTTTDFDPAGQARAVHRPDGTTVGTDYDTEGHLVSQLDGAGQATTYHWDPQGRLEWTKDPLLRQTSFSYDPAGNRTSSTDPANGVTTWAYDAADQVSSIAYSNGRTPGVSAIGYDANGRRTTMADGTGTSTWAWDSLGRLVAQTTGAGVNGAGATVGYGYDLEGNVTSIDYPDSPTHRVVRAYDDAGRLASVTDWLGHTTTFAHDADDEVATTDLPASTAVRDTSGYDNAHNLTSITSARSGATASSFTYTPGPSNLLASVTSTGAPPDNHAFTYTALDQLGGVDARAYGYDRADNLAQAPSGATQSFDAANQLAWSSGPIALVGTAGAGDATSTSLTVALPSARAAGDQILVAATLASAKSVATPTGYTLVGTYPSGTSATAAKVVVWRRTAVAADTSVSLSFGSAYPKSVVLAAYRGVSPSSPLEATTTTGRAAPGTTVSAPSLTTTLAGERLVMVQGAGAASSAGTWTPPGGMAQQVQRPGGTSVATALADQALGPAGPSGPRQASFSRSAQLVGVLIALRPAQVGYGYDPMGNRTTVSPPAAPATTLAYDQADRLTSFGTSASFTYDGDGLRATKTVAATTTRLGWDTAEGLPLVLGETTAGATTSYVYGPGGLPVERIDASGAVLYYHHDRLGSTRSLTDPAGAVVATYSFDPYGKPVASTGSVTQPFGYAGQYTDAETGLVYLRARYYDPATGQFLSRDPLTATTRSPYGYADGDPLSHIDPTGLCPWGMGEICHVAKHDVLPAAHDIADWATTPTELPNSRFFTGTLNAFYGGYKVADGVVLLTVGTVEDVTGVGAVLGVPTQAYGIYQLGTGAARIYRGYKQLDDAFSHPTDCKTPLHYGEDIGLDLAPFGGSIEKLLGGLP